jgi:hypothetical protein
LATPADLVRDNCTQLVAFRPRLEELITDQPSPAGGPAAMAPRPGEVPFPGDAQAFGMLMIVWEAVFRIEERLRDEDAEAQDGYDLSDYPRQRRPGNSTGSFLAALDAIPKLAAGRDEDMEAWAARALDRLNNVIRAHPAIDEAERWRPVPSRPCPYCRCYFLRVLIDSRGQPAGRVGCFGHLPSGEPCRAAWASLAEIAQDLERAETADLDG